MKIKNFEAYQAVISTGSTQGAADMLGISQSAVSRRLSQLEQELDLELFYREGSRLVPSRISGLVSPHIADVLERMHLLLDAAAELREGNHSQSLLRIAVPPGISRRIIPQIVAGFLKIHPHARFEILHGTYEVIRKMLEDKQAEVGFLRLPLTEDYLSNAPVIHARSVCAMAPNHPLAQRQTIRPDDLKNEPLVLLAWKRAPRHDLDLVFSAHGLRPNIRLEAHSVSSACGFAAEGIGIAIVNSLLIQDCMDLDVVVRPFLPDVPHYFAFAYPGKPEMSEVAQHFVDFATSQLQNLAVNG